MMKLALLLVVCGLQLATCKIFDRCDLARQLANNYNVPRDQLNNWVCIAKGESDYNTGAVNTNNVDGTWDYGIFQLNSGYWCQGPATKSNGCGVDCSAFLSDDISQSVRCAKLVIQQQGFSAWVAWNQKCQGDLSGYTAGCGV